MVNPCNQTPMCILYAVKKTCVSILFTSSCIQSSFIGRCSVNHPYHMNIYDYIIYYICSFHMFPVSQNFLFWNSWKLPVLSSPGWRAHGASAVDPETSWAGAGWQPATTAVRCWFITDTGGSDGWWLSNNGGNGWRTMIDSVCRDVLRLLRAIRSHDRA